MLLLVNIKTIHRLISAAGKVIVILLCETKFKVKLKAFDLIVESFMWNNFKC